MTSNVPAGGNGGSKKSGEKLVQTLIKLEIRHRIENFRSAAKLWRKDEKVLSDKAFSPLAPKYLWQLSATPNNNKDGSKFYLYLNASAVREASLKATHAIAAKNASDQVVYTIYKTQTTKFTASMTGWGSSHVPHASLAPAIHPDGSLLIVAKVEFYASVPASCCNTAFQPPGNKADYKAKIIDSLSSLLKSGMKSDLTIAVGNDELVAHQLILAARSPVFKVMFGDDSCYEETKNGVLKINEFAKEAVEGMLSFVYTGEIDGVIVNEWAESLLRLADKYELDEMKSFMEERVAASLCVDTFVDVALLADATCCQALKEACVVFLRRNVDQVTCGEAWKQLEKGARASVAAELLRMAFSRR